jgi:hypothetical protein
MTHGNLAVPRPGLAGGAPATAEPLGPDGRFLFEMLVADLNWTSVQIGMLCIMAAACAARGGRNSLRALRHVAHDDTRVVRLALRYGENAGLPGALERKLDTFYADLSVMQTQIAPLVGVVALSRAQLDKISRLLPSIRRVVLAASDALREVEPFARARLHPNYVHDSNVIREFLGRAARGELSDVDPKGVVNPPALSQRRQSPRVSVNKPCRIACDGEEFDAVLVDISRDGLGLLCRTPLAEKQAVEALVDGRRLAAVVARRNGERLGLSLTKPLTFNDPLYRGD